MAAGSDDVGEKKKPELTIGPGDVIWCRTVLGEEYKGEVMGYDDETQAVVIKSSPVKTQSKTLFDVSIVNLNHVSKDDFKLIEKLNGTLPPLPDLDKIKTERRLKTAKERVGVGVSPEGQRLFDFIRKTISECQWDGQTIVILNDIKIIPPYQLDNCRGESSEYIKTLMTKFYSENTTTESPVTT